MSREAQNEAAKIHLAASIRLGEVVKGQEKADGGDAQRTRLQVATELNTPTYADLGLEKTDAFRVQRLYDWEQSNK